MPVVSHSQKRKKWLGSGCSVERTVRLMAVQKTVTETMVTWVSASATTT